MNLKRTALIAVLASDYLERLAQAATGERYDRDSDWGLRITREAIVDARRQYSGAWAADTLERIAAERGIAAVAASLTIFQASAHQAGRVREARPLFSVGRDGRDEWLRSAISNDSGQPYLIAFQRGAREISETIYSGWLRTQGAPERLGPALATVLREHGGAGLEGALSILQGPLSPPEGQRVAAAKWGGHVQGRDATVTSLVR